MEKQYRLIVSDFDGTLRSRSGGVSEGNAEAIREYIGRGGIFALCTGRMPNSIVPHAERLGLNGPIAAYQGALIRDIRTGEIMRDCRIPCEDAVRICRVLQEGGAHLHVYDGDTLYVNKDDDFRRWYEEVCCVRGILTPPEIDKTVAGRGISPHKIIVVCDAADRAAVFAAAEAEFGRDFYITTSTENLVEVVSRGCDKGDALRFLAGYYGVPVEQTIGIGDNHNDLPLVQAAGLGVAVGNAAESLKRAADVVSPRCEEDGVGYIVRKYGLGETRI